jgi:hypothetical protein
MPIFRVMGPEHLDGEPIQITDPADGTIHRHRSVEGADLHTATDEEALEVRAAGRVLVRELDGIAAVAHLSRTVFTRECRPGPLSQHVGTW